MVSCVYCEVVGLIAESLESAFGRSLLGGFSRTGIKASDKWSGPPPAGFTRDEEGYLALDTEVFLNILHSIERVEEQDASYRSEASNLDISRQALSSLHKEHSDRYLEDPNPVVQQVFDDSELATT